MREIEIGRVSTFFALPVVVAIRLTGPLKIEDRLRITGHTKDLEFIVESIQIENDAVQEAKAGYDVGVRASDRVRPGDLVYVITE